MPAAFGPVILATSWIPGMLACAEKTPSDFAREVPEGTRYVVKSVALFLAPLAAIWSCLEPRWIFNRCVQKNAPKAGNYFWLMMWSQSTQRTKKLKFKKNEKKSLPW